MYVPAAHISGSMDPLETTKYFMFPFHTQTRVPPLSNDTMNDLRAFALSLPDHSPTQSNTDAVPQTALFTTFSASVGQHSQSVDLFTSTS